MSEWPDVSENYRGFLVTLEEFTEAIFWLVLFSGETDIAGVGRLLRRAQRYLVEGSPRPPSFASALRWECLTGINPREEGLQESAQRIFEYNRLDGQGGVFNGLAINVLEISPGRYLVTIDEDMLFSERRPDELEIKVAGALGIERVLTSTAVRFPLDISADGNVLSVDLEPYIKGLRELGIGPIVGTSVRMTDKVVIEHLLASLKRNGGSGVIPTVCFACQNHPEFIIEVGVYGIELNAKPPLSWLEDTKIAGPIARAYRDSSVLKPALRISIERLARGTGEPAWAMLTTPELKAPMLELLSGIAGILGR